MPGSKWLAMAVSAGLAVAAGSATAASDFLLEIEGIEGEAAGKDHKQTIEIASYSWGASNPASVGSTSMSAGEATKNDVSVTSVSADAAGGNAPRDATTGQASGKRTHKPIRVATGDLDGDGKADVAAAPADGTVAQLTVRLRESPTRASADRMCARGKHFPKATLRGPTDGVELQDAVVSSCSVDGGVTTLVLSGTAKHTKSGHVTLLK